MNNSRILIDFYYKYLTKHKIQIKKLFKESFDIPNDDIKHNTIIISYIYEDYIVAMNCLINNDSNDGLFMHNLCVLKSFQGKGLGKLLMNNTIQFIKYINKKTLSLQVYDDNKVAINLYKKFGMKSMNSGMDPITKKSMTTYFRWCD